MRKRSMFVLAFLISLYIVPMLFVPYSMHTTIPTRINMSKDFVASSFWYGDSWLYRKEIAIIEQAGAGTNYQIPIIGYFNDPTKDVAGSIDFEGVCQNDFDDIIFTSSNGVSLLDFFIDNETYILGTSAKFWVEVTANTSMSDMSIFCYFGNPSVETLSDPDTTFLMFDDFENNNLNRWDLHGSGWSTTTAQKKYGSYSAYGDATATLEDRQLFSYQTLNTGAYLIHAYIRFVEIGAYHKWGIHLANDAVADVAGIAGYENDWIWYNGSVQYIEENTLAADTWYELEFAFDFSSGLAWTWIDGSAKGSRPFVTFANSAVTETSMIGSMTSSSANKDHWLDNYYIRKWTVIEPTFGAPSEIETNEETYAWSSIDEVELTFELPNWEIIGTIIIKFVVPLFLEIINALLIFLGMVLIPVSTLFLAYSYKHNMSIDKGFFGLVIFGIGWALLLGGIFA